MQSSFVAEPDNGVCDLLIQVSFVRLLNILFCRQRGWRDLLVILDLHMSADISDLACWQSKGLTSMRQQTIRWGRAGIVAASVRDIDALHQLPAVVSLFDEWSLGHAHRVYEYVISSQPFFSWLAFHYLKQSKLVAIAVMLCTPELLQR